ncbi:hypothetical protein [Corynebacterium freneyi]|uniref:hypothetical protein n=1 Tax=Corynebacterium freneyi TaxID=134034 RepID=UPI001CCF9D52|nr:hypothetical protein [Corynebacterium freneyi]UBI01945.1 hypothetical protein LA334_10670 [Corynebacterium freneyi]
MKFANSLLAYGVMTCMVASLLLGFQLMRELDERGALWATGGILVEYDSGKREAANLRAELSKYALDIGASLIYEDVDPFGDGSITYLYVAPGDSRDALSKWVDDGYPEFSTSREIQMGSLVDAPSESVHGVYYVNGSSGAEYDFAEFFERRGYRAQVLDHYLVEVLLGSSIVIMTGLVLLLVLVLGAAHMIARSHDVAVQRMLGRDMSKIVLAEIGRAVRGALWPCLFAVAATSVMLMAYNNLAQFGAYALISIAFFVISLIVLAGGAVLAGLILGMVGVLPALKGRISGLGLIVGAQIVRIVALVIAFSSLAALGSFSLELARREGEVDKWKSHSDVYSLSIRSGVPGHERDIAPWVREVESAGRIYRVDPHWSVGRDGGLHQQPIVLVNSEFAKDIAQVDPSILPNVGEVVLAVPQGSAASTLRQAEDSLAAELEFSDASSVRKRVESIPSGREVFTFSTDGSAISSRSVVVNPLLVIIANGSEVVGDYNTAAGVTQSTILFRGDADIRRFLQTPEGLRNVHGFRPRVDSWAESGRQLVSEFRSNGIVAAVAIALTVMSAVSICLIYQLIRIRDLRVRFLLGMGGWSGRLSIVGMELALGGLAIGWLVHRNWRVWRALENGVPSADILQRSSVITPGVAGLVLLGAGLGFVATVVMVYAFNRNGELSIRRGVLQ